MPELCWKKIFVAISLALIGGLLLLINILNKNQSNLSKLFLADKVRFPLTEKADPCPGQFIKPFKNRKEIGAYLEELKLRTGAELGVQTGEFSEQVLSAWPSCTKYFLIDTWAVSTNYRDGANVPKEIQNARYQQAIHRLQRFDRITEFVRNRTDEAVKKIPNSSLDFVYVDARHDYCACKQDLEQWWPKLRRGGILAGHDYVSDDETGPQSNYRLCEDGRLEPGSVKRAVNEFAMKRGLSVVVGYREAHYNSYIMRKP